MFEQFKEVKRQKKISNFFEEERTGLLISSVGWINNTKKAIVRSIAIIMIGIGWGLEQRLEQKYFMQ